MNDELTAAETSRRCLRLFEEKDADPCRCRLFSALAGLFSSLADRRDFAASYPGVLPLFREAFRSIREGSAERAEETLTLSYATLHGADSSYTRSERSALDEAKGYWCHAGGLSPLWRAAPWIGPGSRVADYGAGNGLQGLLLQHLYPHQCTTLIELSGEMIARGKRLQTMMGIPSARVEWVHGSVEEVPPDRFDFIYIYRPLKPEGTAGRRFYSAFARTLGAAGHPVTIFSVADCLRGFLDPSFEPFYDDGQLTCFTNRPRC